MTGAEQLGTSIIRELEAAHEQLLERDQVIHDLVRENEALRAQLEAAFETRAWRLAEHYRRLRTALNRR